RWAPTGLGGTSPVRSPSYPARRQGTCWTAMAAFTHSGPRQPSGSQVTGQVRTLRAASSRTLWRQPDGLVATPPRRREPSAHTGLQRRRLAVIAVLVRLATPRRAEGRRFLEG